MLWVDPVSDPFQQDVQVLAGLGIVRLESESFLELADRLTGLAFLIVYSLRVIVYSLGDVVPVIRDVVPVIRTLFYN